MVAEWDSVLVKEEIVQSTLMFDRYKLSLVSVYT